MPLTFQVFQILPIKYSLSFLPVYNCVDTSSYGIYDLLPSIIHLSFFLVFRSPKEHAGKDLDSFVSEFPEAVVSSPMLHMGSLGNCCCSSEGSSRQEPMETPLLVSVEERKAEDLGLDY